MIKTGIRHLVRFEPSIVTALQPLYAPGYHSKCCRYQSTAAANPKPAEVPAKRYQFKETWVHRIKKLFGVHESSKGFKLASGYKIFVKISKEINYKDFFQHCHLEDTYASYFFVLELHVWLASARLMEEGKDGKIVRNSMISTMWQDTDVRTKKLEGALAAARKEQVQMLSDSMKATILSLDEGLLGSDKILAGAIWRRMYKDRVPENQEELQKQIQAIELLVIFIRAQYQQWNALSRDKFMNKQEFGLLKFDRHLFRLVNRV